MLKEFILSEVVLSIIETSRISESIDINENLFQTLDSKIELCNAILISHKRRYISAIDDNAKQKEIDFVLLDYNFVFLQHQIDFLPEELIVSLFKFIVIENVRATEFREACVDLVSALELCSIQSILISCYSKIMNRILRGALYGMEPYNTILKQALEILQRCDIVNDLQNNVLFLE